MSQAFVEGKRVPVTKVLAGPCVVTQLKTDEKDGYRAIHFDIKNSDGTISELQLKTPNQQKWASTVHNRVYKIPKDKLEETKKLMPEIKDYTSRMSDHFFAIDSGEESTAPPCPPKIQPLGLCM